MKIKKSLEVAISNAEQMSRDHPKIIYYVMDKKGKHAVVHSSVWCYRERILDNYHLVTKYLNGKEI